MQYKNEDNYFRLGLWRSAPLLELEELLELDDDLEEDPPLLLELERDDDKEELLSDELKT